METSEAAAAQFGLQLALRFGISRVHLEGDAMNVVQAISDTHQGLAPIYHIYDTISTL